MASGILFRYLEVPNKLQAFRVLYEDRQILASCKNKIHEWGLNANECCQDGKYYLRGVISLAGQPTALDGTPAQKISVPMEQVQFVPYPASRRTEFDNRNFDRDGREIVSLVSGQDRTGQERTGPSTDEILAKLRPSIQDIAKVPEP